MAGGGAGRGGLRSDGREVGGCEERGERWWVEWWRREG